MYAISKISMGFHVVVTYRMIETIKQRIHNYIAERGYSDARRKKEINKRIDALTKELEKAYLKLAKEAETKAKTFKSKK